MSPKSPMSVEEHATFQPIGKHLIRAEQDSVEVIVRGPLTIDDVRALFVVFGRVQSENGRLFILYDAREATGIDAAARQYAASFPSTTQEADLQVVYGLSFGLRVILNMVMRAQKLLRHRNANFHVADNEAAARALFETEREKLRQKE